MDLMHAVLLGLFLIALGGAVWMGVRLVGARAEADNARAESQRVSNEAAAQKEDAARLREESRALDIKRVELEAELDKLAAQHQAELRRSQDLHAEQLRSAEQRERDFKDNVSKRDTEVESRFRSLASQALSSSNEELLKLARQMFTAVQQQGVADIEKRKDAVDRLVQPIGETLQKTHEKLESLEKAWATDRGALNEQLKAVGLSSDALRSETGKLVKALREPHVRGRYGEIQLKRVAELSGMAAYCDFATQDSTRDSEGLLLRPDMVVRMPNGRTIVVDAKTNIQAYLDAQHATTPEDVDTQLDRFARHVAEQATALAKKKYPAQFEGSPDFTVMFLPHDAFLDAALARRPELIEQAWASNVIFATPSSLIALLRAVYVGYQEQKLAQEAKALFALGKELHQRAAIAFGKVQEVGEAIVKASDKYNEFVASYSKRLQPTLQKFEDAGVKSDRDLPEIEPLAVETRRFPGLEAPSGPAQGD
jgi:DNA recombination protein RmuC